MNKEQIQKKRETLEVEFKKIEENRQKALEIVSQCTQQLTRLQGAYALLDELEKELTIENKEDDLEKQG